MQLTEPRKSRWNRLILSSVNESLTCSFECKAWAPSASAYQLALKPRRNSLCAGVRGAKTRSVVILLRIALRWTMLGDGERHA